MTTSESIFDNDPLLITEKKKFFPNIAQAWVFPICYFVIAMVFNAMFVMFFSKKTGEVDYYIFLSTVSLLLFCLFLAISLILKRKAEPTFRFSLAMPSGLVIILLPFITFCYSIFFIGIYEWLHLDILSHLAPGIRLARENPLAFVVISLLLEPIMMEAFFRGILLDSFLKKYSPITAILNISVIAFTFYLSPILLVYIVAANVLHSWMYYKTGNLSINIYTRFLFNFSGLLPLFFIHDNFDYRLERFLTDPIWVIGSGVVLIVALFLLHRVFISTNKK